MSYGILVDVTRCTGCERCCDACVEANGLDPETAARDRATASDGLSGQRFLSVVPVAEGRFARKSCLHCDEPSCVAACLVGAIRKSPAGPVEYDPAKCIGCRYCMLACPIGIPRYEWAQAAPFMRKCSMCADKLRAGAKAPACVEACPHGALKFGEREALLREAHALIESHPRRYRPRVWGEHAWGGTSVLYVSDVDLAPMGWPDRGAPAIPTITEHVIRKTPWLAGSVFLGLWALGGIVARRQKLMAGDAAQPGEDDRPHDPEEASHD
jgi:formate dehydrogenase iron-sulfur subunit